VDPETLIPVTPERQGSCSLAPRGCRKVISTNRKNCGILCGAGGEVHYRTKDVLELKNGELCYVDRSADVIKHKGYRVSASEIEAVLQDNPAVIGLVS